MFNNEYQLRKEELNRLLREIKEDRKELDTLLFGLKKEVNQEYQEFINSPDYKNQVEPIVGIT